MTPGLEHAIETARLHIPVQAAVVKPECWVGFTIVLDDRGLYHVYSDSAWVEQHESMLPWSAPIGTPVGHVSLDGTFTEIGV
jgi:hypothetical protein